jgi:hypothetical protein
VTDDKKDEKAKGPRMIEVAPSIVMNARGPDGRVRRLRRGLPQIVDANDPTMAPFIGTTLVPTRR